MWADSRGDKYYDVIPSGDQHFAVRTTDAAGRVVRYTKNLICHDAQTGAFLWQGAHRTFELDTSGMPTRLVWRCRAGGRSFTWTPTAPLTEGAWPGVGTTPTGPAIPQPDRPYPNQGGGCGVVVECVWGRLKGNVIEAIHQGFRELEWA